ncbi:galanin-like peptide isoform X1 [Panthera onca]
MAEEAGPSTVPATSWVPIHGSCSPPSSPVLLPPPLPSPELHLLQSRGRPNGKKTALEVLDLWKAIDGLPNPHPQQATKKSPRETLAKPETADPGELSKKAPREGEVLQS